MSSSPFSGFSRLCEDLTSENMILSVHSSTCISVSVSSGENHVSSIVRTSHKYHPVAAPQSHTTTSWLFGSTKDRFVRREIPVCSFDEEELEVLEGVSRMETLYAMTYLSDRERRASILTSSWYGHEDPIYVSYTVREYEEYLSLRPCIVGKKIAEWPIPRDFVRYPRRKMSPQFVSRVVRIGVGDTRTAARLANEIFSCKDKDCILDEDTISLVIHSILEEEEDFFAACSSPASCSSFVEDCNSGRSYPSSFPVQECSCDGMIVYKAFSSYEDESLVNIVEANKSSDICDCIITLDLVAIASWENIALGNLLSQSLASFVSIWNVKDGLLIARSAVSFSNCECNLDLEHMILAFGNSFFGEKWESPIRPEFCSILCAAPIFGTNGSYEYHFWSESPFLRGVSMVSYDYSQFSQTALFGSRIVSVLRNEKTKSLFCASFGNPQSPKTTENEGAIMPTNFSSPLVRVFQVFHDDKCCLKGSFSLKNDNLLVAESISDTLLSQLAEVCQIIAHAYSLEEESDEDEEDEDEDDDDQDDDDQDDSPFFGFEEEEYDVHRLHFQFSCSVRSE